MKSKLITPAGYKKRQEEHDYLWKDKRPNFYNKRILRQIDRRVRYLRKRLEELNVIDYSP